MSHKYVAGRAATFLKDDYRNLRIITCHLGNGCSVAGHRVRPQHRDQYGHDPPWKAS